MCSASRPAEGYETPWHQDGHYWPIRPLANCTVWVALEESTVENGCLRVIPRSHRDQMLHEHLHEDRTRPHAEPAHGRWQFDEAQAVDLELEPGQMSLHDVYMIHGAEGQPLGAAAHRRRAALHAVDFGVRARPAARPTARPAWRSTSRTGRCGCCRASTAAAATTSGRPPPAPLMRSCPLEPFFTEDMATRRNWGP